MLFVEWLQGLNIAVEGANKKSKDQDCVFNLSSTLLHLRCHAVHAGLTSTELPEPPLNSQALDQGSMVIYGTRGVVEFDRGILCREFV